MKTSANPRRMTVAKLAATSAASLALALALAACQNVQSYTQPSLVRVIDASYNAPYINVSVAGDIVAANIGQGNFTPYSTIPAAASAVVKVMSATGGVTLTTSSGTFKSGKQHSILIADNGNSSTSSTVPYEVTVLEDASQAAAQGHSSFRFINEAPALGAIDVYLVPSGSTLAEARSIVDNLAVGQAAGYVNVTLGQTASSFTLAVLKTGSTLVTTNVIANSTGSCVSWSLTGGEVYTVVITDSQLTNTPIVIGYCKSDLSQ